MTATKSRKVGFWEAVLAVYVTAVMFASLFATIGFQIQFPLAVKWSAIVCGVLALLYLLSAATDRATKVLVGKKRRKPSKTKKVSAGDIPRGLVHKIERRAEKAIKQHSKTLARKRCQLCISNDYGGVDDAHWRREQEAFIETVILKGLDAGLKAAFKRRGGVLAGWRRKMDKHADHADRERAQSGVGIDFRPGMDGFEYEAFCARILDEADWDVSNKGDSGDQGVDLIARRGRDLVIAIQCKRYRASVGNSAVQEIFAGKTTVAPHALAAVVTNSTYTKSAKELALATGVFLLHHDDLPRLADIIREGQTLPQAA